MHVHARTVNRVTVVELAGRFDAHVTRSVASHLERVAEPHQIVVDFSQVTFVDSMGLATLVQAMKRCRQMDGDVRLCGLQQPVRIIFELTRLDRAFQIYDHPSVAISSFTR
jgi:anti-sigma B factor antagonist